MDTLINKFYEGYEGEPEIQFIKGTRDGERTILSIWSGFFDDIMVQFQPSGNKWRGLAYFYHLAIGWEDGKWEVPDIQSALTEFQSITSNIFRFPETPNVLSEICDMLATAISKNEKVWIDMA